MKLETSDSISLKEPSPDKKPESSTHSTSGLADHAREVRENAEAAGKPIKKRKRGRPKKEDTAAGQMEMEAEDRKGDDERRAAEILKGFFGKASGVPFATMSKLYGSHWELGEDENKTLEEVTDIWVRNRLNIELVGNKLFDLVGILTLASILIPRIYIQILILREKIEKDNQDADTNSGDSGIRKVYGSGKEVTPESEEEDNN